MSPVFICQEGIQRPRFSSSRERPMKVSIVVPILKPGTDLFPSYGRPGDYLGGRLRAKFRPCCTQPDRAVSVAKPGAETMTQPVMGRPVMSKTWV